MDMTLNVFEANSFDSIRILNLKVLHCEFEFRIDSNILVWLVDSVNSLAARYQWVVFLQSTFQHTTRLLRHSQGQDPIFKITDQHHSLL